MFFPFKYPFSEGYQTPHTKHGQLSGRSNDKKNNSLHSWNWTLLMNGLILIYTYLFWRFPKIAPKKSSIHVHGLFHFSIQLGSPMETGFWVLAVEIPWENGTIWLWLTHSNSHGKIRHATIKTVCKPSISIRAIVIYTMASPVNVITRGYIPENIPMI